VADGYVISWRQVLDSGAVLSDDQDPPLTNTVFVKGGRDSYKRINVHNI
jgi:hypothetical protein